MIRIHQVDGGYVEIKRRKKRKSTGRKRGRPRKQHIIEPLPKSRKKPFNVILTTRLKQKECLGTFNTEQDAYAFFYNLQNENKKVMFPVRYICNNGINEANYELYILKKLDENSKEDNITLLRNDIGEFVEHDTNMDNWKIIDKCKWDVEETFWVYGYDPFLQRKDFQWIFDNFIKDNPRNYSTFKNILVYKNKLIIDDNENINIIFCKCIEDSFRLYNEIERITTEQKYRNIMFSGNIGDFSKHTISNWIDKLCEVTGFNRRKITRNKLSN